MHFVSSWTTWLTVGHEGEGSETEVRWRAQGKRTRVSGECCRGPVSRLRLILRPSSSPDSSSVEKRERKRAVSKTKKRNITVKSLCHTLPHSLSPSSSLLSYGWQRSEGSECKLSRTKDDALVIEKSLYFILFSFVLSYIFYIIISLSYSLPFPFPYILLDGRELQERMLMIE